MQRLGVTKSKHAGLHSVRCNNSFDNKTKPSHVSTKDASHLLRARACQGKNIRTFIFFLIRTLLHLREIKYDFINAIR
jgi:hypothetical protein